MEEENNIQKVSFLEKAKINWQNFDKKAFWELIRFSLFVLVIVISVRIFIAQPFIVSGSSMVPTFHNGEYLIIDEISYRLNEPQRDDVVVFKYPNDKTKYFIKRIIGLPNETVDVKKDKVVITNKENPEGFTLDETYIINKSNSNTHFELKENEYFVMGDNRPASLDSRSWGSVSRELIIGKVFLRLLPINKIGLLPGDYKQIESK